MRAQIALVLAASLGLAACQGDDVTPPAASPSMNAASAQENFLTVVPEQALDNSQRNLLATIKGRPSTAEVHLARIAAGVRGQSLQQGGVLRIGVAPGVQVVAVGERVAQRSAEDVSWAGPVRGREGWVQMVYTDGGVTATVRLGESTVYSIEPLGNGLHAVSRIDQHGYPSEHTPDNPSGALSDALDAAVMSKPGTGTTEGTVGTSALTTINVLVVHTAAAASATSNIGSLIQLAVDETNQSYVNSGININMTRVHTAQVSYSETGKSFSTHVNNLKGTTDGQMDNVHTLRNTYAADVVVLIVNDSEACGIAAAIKATATTAFAVAHYSCITGYYSFAHEVGHLQGARHDRYVDSSTSPYAYGHGFIPSTKNWRTVMAYGNNCSNCTRIQWWSNPLKTYPSTGQVMGTAAYEDNARVLNGTAATVAAFR
jgi:hypothetical protein